MWGAGCLKKLAARTSRVPEQAGCLNKLETEHLLAFRVISSEPRVLCEPRLRTQIYEAIV